MKNNRILLVLIFLVVFCLTLSVVSATNDNNTEITTDQIQKTTDTQQKTNTIETNKTIKTNKINKVEEKDVKKAGTFYISTTGKSTNAGTENSPLDIQTAFTKVNSANGGNLVISGGTYKLTSMLKLNKAGVYTISGKSGQTVTLDGQKKTRMIYLGNGVTAEIKNIVFTNGYASDWGNVGGAIYVDTGSKANINGNTFTSNSAKYAGAIVIKSSNAVVSNNIFKNNKAEMTSGAVLVTGNSATFTGNSFTSNNAGTKGGAVFVSGTSATFNKNIFDSNTAVNGGSIYNYGSNNLKLTGNTFSSNSATASGGAVYTNGNSTIISNNIFKKNKAPRDGALLIIENKLATITNNTFQENSATGGPGGGLEVNNAQSSTITGNIFTGNKAKRDGGGVSVIGGSGNFFRNNTFTKNYSDVAAGGFFSDSTKLTVIENTFKDNLALRSSAALYDEGIDNTITKNVFEKNSVTGSEGDGGAIFIRTKTGTVSENVFINNYAKRNGGASYFDGKNVKILNNKFSNNKADNSGGAMYVFTTSDMTISLNDFQSNSAKVKGGAIMTSHPTKTYITKNTFNKNTAQTSGGAVLNLDYNVIEISSNTFTYNKAGRDGGALMNQEGSQATVKLNNFLQNNATSSGGAIYNDDKSGSIANNNFTQNRANNNGAAISNRGTNININNNRFVQNVAPVKSSAIVNSGNKATVSNNVNDKTSKYYGTIFTDGSGTKITSNIFDDTTPKPIVTKTATKITVDPVVGIVGGTIKLTAHVTDIKGNKISGGNIAFKLNGKTLRADGKFNSNAAAQKVSVKNGLATISIVADKYIRDAKTVSASYSGTSTYSENSTKTSTNAQIKLRNAKITVSLSPTIQSQYNLIRFTAKVSDITGGKTSSILNNADNYVFWKVNGRTLTYSNGVQVKSRLTNGVATYDYYVPKGMAGISVSKQLRNYSVTAGFASSDYYPGVKDNTYFNVYRSNVTIKLSKVTANVTSHKLTVSGSILDYKGNKVIGTNKINLKVNGKSLMKNNKAVYVSAKEGVISFTIDYPSTIDNVKSITLVTGERCAYTEGRITSTIITKVK